MALTTIDDRGLKTPIDLLDNEKIRFGTGNDLEIYHNGSHSYIDNTGTGNLYLKDAGIVKVRTGTFGVDNADGTETMMQMSADGAVELFYNNVKKFQTYASGVEVIGHQIMGDDDYIQLGDSQDLKLYHDGSNSYLANTTGNLILKDTSGSIYLQSTGIYFQDDTTNENIAKFISDGACELYYDNVKKFETTADGIELSNDANSKVEQKFHYGSNSGYGLITMDSGNNFIFKADVGSASSDSYTAFEIDGSEKLRIASNSRVGIGVTSPNRTLDIQTASNDNGFSLNCIGTPANYAFDIRDDGAVLYRVDNAGRVLIGVDDAVTTSANRLLQVVGDTNGGGIIALARDDTALSNETIGGFEFFGNDPGSAYTRTAGIYVEAAANWSSSDYPSQMIFQTTPDGTSSPVRKLELGHNYVQTNSTFNANSSDNSEALATFVEGAGCKLYHDGSQRLETTGNGATIHSGTTSSPGCLKIDCGVGASDQIFISFEYGGDNSGGGIRRDGTSQDPEFYSGSDRRIKKDIVDLPNQLDKINQIQLKSFGYKNDPDASGRGPIAQDLINIYPNKVTKSDGDDGTGDTVPDGAEPWTIGTGFTWEIIKAIQELSAKVTALEAK